MQYDYSATHDSWLCQAMETKDKAKSLDGWRDRYEKIDRNLKFDQFGFTPKLDDLRHFPSLSFMLHVPFKQRKPYLSKDDRAFHLLDNPVRKDKVFQTPMVAPTSWKGSLRAALWQLEHKEDNEQIIRLFGNEREEEDHKKLKSGRLYFYPSFFDNVDKDKQLEVINPHDRQKGTSKRGPIQIECVPIGATGQLVILYVPFWTVEKTQVTEEERKKEVADDLELVAAGVEAMLTVYGFGAKTSSGFGVADVKGKGELAIRADLPALNEPEIKQSEPELPRYLIAHGQLHPDFQSSDGSLKSEAEYLKGRLGKKEKQLYDKAEKWWEREGRQLAKATTQEPVPEPEPPPPKSSVSDREFNSFESLVTTATELAQQLGGGSNA